MFINPFKIKSFSSGQSLEASQESSLAPQLKGTNFQGSAFFMVQLSHPYMTIGKAIALTTWTFVSKVMSLLFNTLSRFVIDFLPRSKCRLISCLRSTSSVILEPKKIKSHCCHSVPFYLPWNDGTRCHDLFSKCWVLSQLFNSSLSPSSRGSLVPLHFFLPLGWYHLHIWGC